MSAPIMHTRFISLARFRDATLGLPEAVGFSFTSYDVTRDEQVRWVVVADDDPRAETVIHHEERVS